MSTASLRHDDLVALCRVAVTVCPVMLLKCDDGPLATLHWVRSARLSAEPVAFAEFSPLVGRSWPLSVSFQRRSAESVAVVRGCVPILFSVPLSRSSTLASPPVGGLRRGGVLEPGCRHHAGDGSLSLLGGASMLGCGRSCWCSPGWLTTKKGDPVGSPSAFGWCCQLPLG
jgi:hypothetical protein